MSTHLEGYGYLYKHAKELDSGIIQNVSRNLALLNYLGVNSAQLYAYIVDFILTALEGNKSQALRTLKTYPEALQAITYEAVTQQMEDTGFSLDGVDFHSEEFISQVDNLLTLASTLRVLKFRRIVREEIAHSVYVPKNSGFLFFGQIDATRRYGEGCAWEYAMPYKDDNYIQLTIFFPAKSDTIQIAFRHASLEVQPGTEKTLTRIDAYGDDNAPARSDDLASTAIENLYKNNPEIIQLLQYNKLEPLAPAHKKLPQTFSDIAFKLLVERLKESVD